MVDSRSNVDQLERPRAIVGALFPIAIVIGVCWILYSARHALGPYIFGLLIVYLLLPVVHRVESLMPDHGVWVRARRPVAAIVTSVVALVAAIVFLEALVGPIITSARDLMEDLGVYWSTFQANQGQIQQWYVEVVPADIRVKIDAYVPDIGAAMIEKVADILNWLFYTSGSVLSVASVLLAVPLFVAYYLLDEKDTARRLREQMPGPWAADLIAIFRISDRILGSYVRGIVGTATIVGVITGLGYWFIGVELALALAVVAFAGEIVPILGPWIAFFISFPVILATQPDRAVAAVVLFLILQIVEALFIAPRAGSPVEMTAAGTILLLAIGGGVAGGIGVIFAVPVAAILRTLCVYISRRIEGVSPEAALAQLRPFRTRDVQSHVAS